MKNTRGENVFCIRRNEVSAVVSMPSRHDARPARRILTMPSRRGKQSNVVTLVARSESTVLGAMNKPGTLSILRSGSEALSYGVRMTLVALFALLGWPHPTRDNDPGPSAARPSHWELLSLVSRLYLRSSEGKAAAARAENLQISSPEITMEQDAFARAA